MISLAQDGHGVSLHKRPAAVADGAVKPLVVQRTQALAALDEEAGAGQVAAAN